MENVRVTVLAVAVVLNVPRVALALAVCVGGLRLPDALPESERVEPVLD